MAERNYTPCPQSSSGVLSQYLRGHAATLRSTSDGAPETTQYSATRRHYQRTWVRNFQKDGLAEKAKSFWPLRSPDITPLHLFTWSYVKSIVYESPVTRLMTWRSVSRARTWLLTLTCSSEHGKSLNIDRTLSVLPRVPAMKCSNLKTLRVWLQATARCVCVAGFV
jgi:hypothetical protein